MSSSTLIPCMRYRDAPKAIDWLCDVFGFDKHAVYPNPDGSIAHAQLVLGAGMVMLGSVSADPTPWGQLMRQPDEIGGFATQSAYITVPDADVIYHRAMAAGALIMIPIKDEDYGGRGFSCRDLEGHLWSVGSYDPWAAAQA